MKATITTFAILVTFLSNICFPANEPFRTDESRYRNSIQMQTLTDNNDLGIPFKQLDHNTPDSIVDSLPTGVTKSWLNSLHDEYGKRIMPKEPVTDALQRNIFEGVDPNDGFGISLSSAGDVNADGYDDIIIGASSYNSSTGRAYIFFGGLNMNTIADVTLTGEAGMYQFGITVASAGDVNGDGYSDVIVGTRSYNPGRVYIFFGGVAMNDTADIILAGQYNNDYFGYSISSAGDVNGDGYSDVIVGYQNLNSAYIFLGGVSMDNVADVILSEPYYNFGISVASAGDVNADGYSDVIVGASDLNQFYSEAAHIYYGGTTMNSIADVIIMSGAPFSIAFALTVASAGDVNGDGYSDVIIGAQKEGTAYIYFGGASMNNIADVILSEVAFYNYFGYSVSSAGDINGDGFSDVVVGSSGMNSIAGKAYIFFGGEYMDNIADLTMSGDGSESFGAAVSSAGDLNGDGYSEVIVGDLGGLFASFGKVYMYDYYMTGEVISSLSMTGESINNYFGSSVSSAGDVNGDGFSDVIVGAERYNSLTGRAYIFFGSEYIDTIADITITGTGGSSRFGYSVSSAGDVNGDGYSDVIVGAYNGSSGQAFIYFGGGSMNNIADITMNGEAFGNRFGISVSSAGDVNGDGYSDVIVGADGYSSSTGRAYIFFGGISMDNTADVIMTGEATNNNFGKSVSSAGDVNGDGYSDVIVGAERYNSYTGKTYLFYGGALMNSIADISMTGESTNTYFGTSVSSSGDVNKDGYSDVIVGAYGYNSFSGRAYIFFGSASMNNIADIIMDGESTSTAFGNSVSSAGDVNGDGYSDVIVGGNSYNPFGKSYIFFGGASMNNIADVTMTGETSYSYFGTSVSSAGDINGDGFSDVIVGAPGYSQNTGRSYIFQSSNVAPKFKTASSGNWNSTSTWQMSTDGITWVGATIIPNSTSGTITIQSSHIVNLSASDSVDQVVINSGGQLSIDTLITLSIKGVGGTGLILINGGIISGKGTLLMKGTASLSINDSLGFNVICKIKSGVTTCIENPGFVFSRGISIDSGAVLKIQYSNSSVTVYNDIINNGLISGNGTLSINGPSLVNNGSITTSTIRFNSITFLSGTGIITGSDVYAESGSNVSLGSDNQFRSLNIDIGAIFDISSKTLKLFNPGTPLTNNGTLISSTGTIEYNGTAAQTLATTNINYNNLTINNPAGVTLPSNILIPGLLSVVNGSLNLNGDTITLLDSAQLQETPGNTVKGSGSITITKNINQPNSMNVGGLGIVITSPENFGQTTITRINSSQTVSPGRPGINRYYDISPQNNTALNANLIFKYDTSELDTLNESSLGLYRSTNGGTIYTPEGGSVDTANNQITLNHIQSFSRWTAARDSSITYLNPPVAGIIYAKGKYPIKYGSLDTIAAKIRRPDQPTHDSIYVNYVIKQRESFNIFFDTTFAIPYFQLMDTLLHLRLPFIGNPGPYSVIVQAIPDELAPVNGFDLQTYCFDVTCDAFNYAEPCDTIDGGAGFNGREGRMVAGFTNLSTTDVFPIHAIDQSFLDSSLGNVPYKLAIYADNGSGKPGNALYISPALQTPAGSGSVETVTHEINPPVNIPPNSRFYVGYIQTSNTNIKAAFQDEIPVRRSAFFFSNSDTNNVWFDFADSSKNFRLDISPKTSTGLILNAFLEGFYNTGTNKMKSDTVKLEVHSFNAPYDLIDEDKSILDSNGNGIFNFTKVKSDSEYYFVIHHRNHLETWSHGTPEKFDVCDKLYNFTDNISKAFGNNMSLINGKYMILSGDVNQDGIVDASDLSNVENDVSVSLSGYVNTDITGDDYVDASDLSLVENNASQGIFSITP